MKNSAHTVGVNPDKLVERAPVSAPVRDTLSKDAASDTETVVHRREAALASSFETVSKHHRILGITTARLLGDDDGGWTTVILRCSRIHSIQVEHKQSHIGELSWVKNPPVAITHL